MRTALGLVLVLLSLSCGMGGGGLAGGGMVGIGSGGTGQATATAGFNALDPLTSAGDILTHDGTNSIRLAKGTANQLLRTNAGATAVEWATVSSSSYLGWSLYGGDHTGATNEVLSSLTMPSALVSFAGSAVTTIAGTGSGHYTLQIYNSSSATGYGTCEIDCDSAAGTVHSCSWGSPAATSTQVLHIRVAVVFNCSPVPFFNMTNVVGL